MYFLDQQNIINCKKKTIIKKLLIYIMLSR